MVVRRLAMSAVAVAVGLAMFGVAQAQTGAPPDSGLITGEIARCVNGNDSPVAQVSVGIDGGGASLAQSDANGEFFIALPPGQYTVVATSSDGSSANRQYVPVEAGVLLDIGILELGTGINGCGNDSDVVAPAAPAPTAVATVAAVPPTATPAPAAPLPTPTPAPAAVPTPSGG